MCRNIRPLFNFEPPATSDEIRRASYQFVKKVSGFNTLSKLNESVFNDTVSRISGVIQIMLNNLETKANPKNRQEEAEKAAARSAKRFANSQPSFTRP